MPDKTFTPPSLVQVQDLVGRVIYKAALGGAIDAGTHIGQQLTLPDVFGVASAAQDAGFEEFARLAKERWGVEIVGP